MEREPDSENGITKVREFPWETTRKLESNKEININGKRSHKETVQQKRQNPQGLKERDNMWLKAENI